MATKRTIAALNALFAPGQPPRSITPDRVQDLILSLRPGFGRISLASSAETSIASVNTWVKIAGTTALADGAFTFSMPANNRLQCNCLVPSRLEAEAVLSLTNGSQKEYEIAFAKNGTVLTDTIQSVRFGPGGGTVEAVIVCDFVQAQGDFIEVWVRNVTDSTNITATRLYMRARTFVL
jgi:hypothetical protein